MKSSSFYKHKGFKLALLALALTIPFTVFAAYQQQTTQQQAAPANNAYVVTPTLYCLGSCQSAQVSGSPSSIPSTTGPQPSVPTTSQTPLPSAVPSISPCEAGTVSVLHKGKGKKKHVKKKKGGINKGMDALLRFLIEFINLLLRLIGGGDRVIVPPTDPCDQVPSIAPEPSENPGISPTAAPVPSGVVSGVPSPSTPQPSGSAENPAGWQLVASDDFNGTVVDTSKWMIYSGAGNAGVGTRSPSAVTVSNSELKITGKGDVSGGMSHKVNQVYGRWDVRAKIDKGQGYGPAMMLWPSGQGGGDIAFSEIPKGDRSQSVFTVHWSGKQQGHNDSGDFSQWHTFTTEWELGKINYYIDGKLTYTLTSPAEAIPTNPLALVLQNDIGACGSWIGCRDASTPAEVSLHVDWIKVYKR